MSRNQCAFCGRKPLVPGEGRRIDGTWARDSLVARQYQGAWVCSFRCYENLITCGKVEASNPERGGNTKEVTE
jgi:hypothetical protein